MRRTLSLMAASGLASTITLLLLSGCFSFQSDCEKQDGICKSFSPSDGGQGAYIESACDGSPTEIDPATNDLKAFNKGCAVFAYGDAENPAPDGTKENPYPTLQQAIDQANGKWVIACNTVGFTENVTTSNSVQVYGGFSCINLAWKRDESQKTSLTAETADLFTLTVQNKGLDVSVKFQDFTIKALDAMAPAGSSIAVAVDEGLSAALVNCDVTAGNGAAAADEQPPQEVGADGTAALTTGPTAPTNACFAPQHGGAGATTTCPDGTSTGGDGGRGGTPAPTASPGQPGENGDVVDTVLMRGKGGAGATSSTTDCGDGQKGKDGDAGGSGMGGTEIGNLSIIDGIIGADGQSGGAGTPGHGGGGGGGAFHGVFCSATDGLGASGGGGGAGGCGGKGGAGGKAGGSSIAIISVGDKLTLTGVTLRMGNGANGGKGANGGRGGSGGPGALGGKKSSEGGGSKDGCQGGNGGVGGEGGPGGGGRGGHSIGVIYQSTTGLTLELPEFTPGMPGGGGDPGLNGPATGKGDSGKSVACWDISLNLPCAL